MFDRIIVRNGRTANAGIAAAGAHNVRWAYVITMLLSFLLWWVPGLGQAAAGYVGGRKAGTAAMSLVSGALAGASIFVMSLAFSSIVGHFPETANAGFVADYFTSFVTSADGVSTVALNPYALLIMFSMIGGMLAGQARKEAESLIAAATDASRRRHRSVELHAQGKKLGFESYDSCPKISVNTMNPVNRPRADPVEAAEAARAVAEEPPEPVPEPAPVPRQPSPVTSTLDMTMTPSTATSANDENPFAAILRKSDRRAEVPDGREQQDDYEYI